MEIPNDMASFAELQEFVYRTYYYNCSGAGNYFWNGIRKNPIDRPRIIHLKNDGWKINKIPESLLRFEGLCVYDKKEIRISEEHGSYQRDKAICHEIVHAVYGEISMDLYLLEKDDDKKLIKKRNNALTEWYARQIRATPTLLSSIWKNFDISPKIYDLVSLMALDFEITRNPQRIFPSFYKDYNFTLID